MKIVFVLTIISWFVESAPTSHRRLIDQLSANHASHTGFPEREIRRRKIVRDVGAIVFEGQTNARRDDGVIHFPDEHENDDDIDLSGSFKPSKVNQPASGVVTFANCGGFTLNGNFVVTSSQSGVFTYPNGTQVSYSKCVIVQALN